MKRISLAVTTDLNHDQRMQRIALSLQQAGYQVSLIGRVKKSSRPLPATAYRSKRLRTLFEQGFLFYAFFNIRLFLFLLLRPSNAICAVDLDTLPASWLTARLKGNTLFYDAHELFTEVPELLNRPGVRRFWGKLEAFLLPKVDYAYTVNQSLADWYNAKYGIHFAVIRNMPNSVPPAPQQSSDYILYQGALNAGRGIECLLKVIQKTGIPCVIAGDGDIAEELKEQTATLGIQKLVTFTGMLGPLELRDLTRNSWLGVNLLEASSPNYYYSLANKYFDYVQAGKPQICMAFPEYQRLQAEYEVAVLVEQLEVANITAAVNQLRSDRQQYEQLANNCRKAALHWIWELEEHKLFELYAKL